MIPGACAAVSVTLVTLGLCAPLRHFCTLCFSVPHNFRLQSRSLQVCRGVSGALRYFKLSKTARLGKRNNELMASTGLALGQVAVFRKRHRIPKNSFPVSPVRINRHATDCRRTMAWPDYGTTVRLFPGLEQVDEPTCGQDRPWVVLGGWSGQSARLVLGALGALEGGTPRVFSGDDPQA